MAQARPTQETHSGNSTTELPPVKTNKMACLLSEDSDRPV